jgi:glutamine amidotransferase
MEIANYDVTKSHVATATHGTDFVAAIESGRICGTQFHPEKSQKSGLQLMRNFLERF